MKTRAAASFLAGVLLASCYQSVPSGGQEPANDTFLDPVPDQVTDQVIDNAPDAPDLRDTLPEPLRDPGYDRVEYDGSPPPTCRLFSVDVDWDVAVEEPYTSDLFYEPSDEPMLSVISMYEASDCSHHERCPVTVHVTRTYAPVVLVLGSFEPIEWVIDRQEGARISRILVSGVYESSVSGADEVPTEITEGFVGICWPRCMGDDTERQVLEIASRLGIPLTSFHGTRDATELTLRHICREECLEEAVCAGRECGTNECGYECGECPEGYACVGFRCVPCTPDCTARACGSDGCGGSCGSCPEDFICRDGRCVEAPYFTGCGEVTSESHYCLTIGDDGVAVLGLDSGLVCPLEHGSDDLFSYVSEAHSIAFLDGHLHLCIDGAIDGVGVHGILRFSLLDGSWEVAPVPCYALARYENGLLVLTEMIFEPFKIMYYASFEDTRADDAVPLFSALNTSRMTARGDTLYTAWHSTDEVETYRLLSGAHLGTITLEGYDTWVQGMSVTEDGLLICNADWPEGRVAIFDAETGEHIRDVHPVGGSVMGLVCMTNP